MGPCNAVEMILQVRMDKPTPSNLGDDNYSQQHFRVECKKSKLFKTFTLVRSLDDDETSVSLGQVTKLASDAERQVFEGQRSGLVAFQAEPFMNVPVAPLSLGVVRQITSGSLPSSGMLAIDNSLGTGWPPW
ncbi:hypothetical protein TNCV_81861 [Trichonephila clavipes]|nr:hypothetical protein TNCV_81861 [Trichonephila clavipes]